MRLLGAEQHGVLHLRQALDAGLSRPQVRRRVDRGEWTVVHPKVYAIVGAPDSWYRRLSAAVLLAGPGAVVSHLTAAALWQLDVDQPATIAVTLVGTGSRPSRPGVKVHRTRSMPSIDVGRVEGVPVTTAPRTVVDLAGVLEADRLEEVLDAALRQGLTSVGHLEGRLDALGRQGRPGSTALAALLEARRAGRPSESRRELRLARLLVAAGLPPPVRQYELRSAGRVVARFDLAYPALRIGVEYDSYRHHAGRQAWRADRSRHNRATALGWSVLHVTDDDVAAVVAAHAQHRLRHRRSPGEPMGLATSGAAGRPQPSSV